jgi:hypothetical protein
MIERNFNQSNGKDNKENKKPLFNRIKKKLRSHKAKRVSKDSEESLSEE